jgi:hypothetical protein
MEALGNNPEAAQQFFTTGGTTELDLDGQSLEVSERMQYLIQERGWSHMTDPTNGSNLGEALRAATNEYRDQTEQGRTSAELATQMFLLIGDKTGDGSSDGFLGMGGDEGWEMWDGMRDEVAEVVASYAPDLLRIAQRDAADRLDGLSVAPEEDLYGDGAPYGAALDPDLMQKIIGTLAENDDHMDTVLAGVGAATDIRISTALHDALGDQASVPAPVALLLGNTVPEISSATDESASALGWVLNAGYHGRLDDEEFEKKQAEARAALFDTLTSVPGVGPAGKWSSAVFNETVKHISTGIKKTDATAGSDYGELSAGEREHLEQMILNKLLSQGYLEDEYVDEANGGQGDRFSAPPRSAVISGDPPRFDFESDEYLAWRRDRFPYDDFLNSHVFPGFTMKLNAGLSLGGR